MTNYPALEWIAMVAGVIGLFWLICDVMTKSLPRAFKAIHQWWFDARPDDRSNHR